MVPCHHESSAFTLIELLVVIAILAVLLAVIVPVVSHSLEKARCVQCSSNLRQMYTACTLYAGENQNRFPNGVTQSADFNYYVDTGETTPWLQDQLITYLGGIEGDIGNIWRCPSCKAKWLKDDPNANHYRYNVAWAGGTPMANIPSPVEAILFFDTAWGDWPKEELPHDGVNVVFADGHTARIPAETFLSEMTDDLMSDFMAQGWE